MPRNKFEQSVLDYIQLIEDVRTFNEEAALYLKNKAIHLRTFRYDKYLGNCFIWSDTPQGHDYWANIRDELRKLRN